MEHVWLIKKIFEEWISAELTGNVKKLTRMLSNDFIGIGPRGNLITKDDWLKRFDNKMLHYEKFDYSEYQLRNYDGASIVTACTSQKGYYKGHSFQVVYRATLFFVNVQYDGSLVSIQLSPAA